MLLAFDRAVALLAPLSDAIQNIEAIEERNLRLCTKMDMIQRILAGNRVAKEIGNAERRQGVTKEIWLDLESALSDVRKKAKYSYKNLQRNQKNKAMEDVDSSKVPVTECR